MANIPYCLLYNSYDVSSDNFVLDPVLLPSSLRDPGKLQKQEIINVYSWRSRFNLLLKSLFLIS